jgi:hypothetical protein
MRQRVSTIPRYSTPLKRLTLVKRGPAGVQVATSASRYRTVRALYRPCIGQRRIARLLRRGRQCTQVRRRKISSFPPNPWEKIDQRTPGYRRTVSNSFRDAGKKEAPKPRGAWGRKEYRRAVMWKSARIKSTTARWAEQAGRAFGRPHRCLGYGAFCTNSFMKALTSRAKQR